MMSIVLKPQREPEGSPRIVTHEVAPADLTGRDDLEVADLANLDAGRQDAFEMASGPRDFGNLEVARKAGRSHA